MLFSGESGRCNLRILLPLPPSLLSPPHCPTRSSCRQGCGTMELFAWWGNNWNNSDCWPQLILRPQRVVDRSSNVRPGWSRLPPSHTGGLPSPWSEAEERVASQVLAISFSRIKIKINQSPNWCFRLLLRAAREDVGEGVEEGEDGQPGKVSPSRHLAPSLFQMVYLTFMLESILTGGSYKQQQQRGQPWNDRDLSKLLRDDAREQRIPQPSLSRSLIIWYHKD